MDRRDRDLLDKQFCWLHSSPRSDGILVLVFVGIFVAGIAFGMTVVQHETSVTKVVSSDTISPEVLVKPQALKFEDARSKIMFRGSE